MSNLLKITDVLGTSSIPSSGLGKRGRHTIAHKVINGALRNLLSLHRTIIMKCVLVIISRLECRQTVCKYLWDSYNISFVETRLFLCITMAVS
jgi:hypothetical protein